MLTEVLAEAGLDFDSPVAALSHWDAERLALALHADPARAKRMQAWGRAKGFAPDIAAGDADQDGKGQSAEDWRNQMLRAMEAGRKAGAGIGRLGAILADLAPGAVPWEIHLRGLLAQALTERPRISWRRPAGQWVARLAEAERTRAPTPPFEPGRARMDHRPRLVIGLDTSSSIDALTLRMFMAEAEAITRRTGAETHLLVFDTSVSVQHRLDPQGWAIRRDHPLRQGGGTDYTDLFAKAVALAPALAVVLTDLDATLRPAPPFPLLCAVPEGASGAAPTPSYGRKVTLPGLG